MVNKSNNRNSKPVAQPVVNINHAKIFKRFLVCANGSKYTLIHFDKLGIWVKVPLKPSKPVPTRFGHGWRDSDFIAFDDSVVERMLSNPNFKLIPQ